MLCSCCHCFETSLCPFQQSDWLTAVISKGCKSYKQADWKPEYFILFILWPFLVSWRCSSFDCRSVLAEGSKLIKSIFLIHFPLPNVVMNTVENCLQYYWPRYVWKISKWMTFEISSCYYTTQICSETGSFKFNYIYSRSLISELLIKLWKSIWPQIQPVLHKLLWCILHEMRLEFNSSIWINSADLNNL